MNHEQHSRTAMLLGEAAVDRLAKARVAVFGVGGVGGYIAEALARAGVGALDLIDSDTVSVSNINRQIIALHSTVGRLKVDVMAERIRDINPACQVRTYPMFYLPETAGSFDFSAYDYVADAVDTVSAKLDLAVRAHEAGVQSGCAARIKFSASSGSTARVPPFTGSITMMGLPCLRATS